MLVLNNLPKVQVLNGRSTKDEDDDEEVEGEGEYGDNNENEEDNQGNIFHNENINSINNRNSHLYPQMEEIEEDKNLENNYISETNNDNNNENNDNNNANNNDNNNDNNNKDNMDNNDADLNNNNDNNIKDLDLYGENEKEKTNWNNKENSKEKKLTRNINTLKEKDLNQKIDSNNDDLFKPNSLLYNKIISDNSNKKLGNSNNEEKNEDINININIINGNNNSTNYNKQMKQKESEPIFDLNNSKNSKNEKKNYLIDITNEELNSIKEEKYNKNSEFYKFIIEFCNLLNNDEESSDGQRIQNNYNDKLNSIEEKKIEIPNYYYFYLLLKKKIKIIQNMYNEIIPYIINKCPELNKNNVLVRLNNELFNAIKDSKELISTLHSHIELYNENKNNKDTNQNENNEINSNENNLNQIIKEKDNKILSLEQIKIKLLKNLEDDKLTYEKKISNLEKENKIMTERIFTKANSMISSSIADTQASYPVTDRYMAKSSNNKKKFMFNNELLNTNFINHYNPINTSRSPIKLTENTNTEINNTVNYLNTHGNINNNRQQLITLKTLKDFINELYLSKSQYDIKCTQNKLPKETLEEYMYTFLNKKYGLKNLIIEWAKNIIAGIKYYSKKDSIVLLFGKIMRNEQEEDARFIIQKVSESIEELLLYYIKRQNPLKLVNEIKKIFEEKKKSELFEEEWKGIIYSIYEKQEAEEIEKKIINFINKENEKKKMEMLQKYKNSRMNNQNKNKITNNNININNSYYLNTINSFNNISNNNNNTNPSYMNTVSNINNNNNKQSRVEKYNMLLFSEDKNILFTDFIKIVLDNHIKFRDKQLKNFVNLFRSVDTNRDGVINEEEFSELIHKMKVFKEEEVENKIFQFLEKMDPFVNQKFTFSECVNFFSSEIIKNNDINGEEKEISILEKICFKENKNENVNNEINSNNNNEINENEQVLNTGIDSNNNINNSNKNSNDNNNK